MTNFNANEFLNTLTEEQKTKVLTCKTEEEITQVIDEYDIEIPDEMLAEVTGGKGFIPALLASIMVLSSASAIAPVPVSAAEINQQSYVELLDGGNIGAVSYAAVSAEDYGKKAGIAMADEAFGTLGNAFPGAGLLVAPFKTLFHVNVDNNSDPMAAMNDKLDKMDQKLDDIQTELKHLNNNIDVNTKWLGNKTELSELKTNFRNLSAVLESFAKDVYAVETDDDLNNQQKMMKLATLKNSADFRDVKNYCTVIRDYMDGSNKYVSDCMFDLLYNDKAAGCMVESEAYNEAYGAAEDLTKQYVYAVSLLAECQRAADAVYYFKDADVKALGDGALRTAYNSFDKNREILDASDASKMLVAAATGVKSFQKHDNGTMIFKTSKSLTDVIGRSQNVNLYKDMKSVAGDYVKKSTISTDEIKQLASYVREKYPNTSLYDYLKKYGALAYTFDVANSGTAYLLTSTNLDTKEKDAGTEFAGKIDGALLYDCTVYAKGINIYDPKCEEQSFKVYTYRREDIYGWGIKLTTNYVNCYNYSNKIFTIYNNLSDDEQKAYAPTKEYNTFKWDHPEMTFDEYKNIYRAFKASFPAFGYKDYEVYREWRNSDERNRFDYSNPDKADFYRGNHEFIVDRFNRFYNSWKKEFPHADIETLRGYLSWGLIGFGYGKPYNYRIFLDWEKVFLGNSKLDGSSIREFIDCCDWLSKDSNRTFQDYVNYMKK